MLRSVGVADFAQLLSDSGIEKTSTLFAMEYKRKINSKSESWSPRLEEVKAILVGLDMRTQPSLLSCSSIPV